VDWNDRNAKKNLYVGRAINDFVEMHRHDSIEPVKREEVRRVRSSMALRMADGDYIPLLESIAERTAPIVINNACGSWHRLAGEFLFGNARCYLGTLFSVVDLEAQQVLDRLFSRYYDKELAFSLWRTQNEVYGDSARRPYVLCGCHFQRLTTRQRSPTIRFILAELSTAYVVWRRKLRQATVVRDPMVKTIVGYVRFLESELAIWQKFAKGKLPNAYYRRR
jgi:hypothetical protein